MMPLEAVDSMTKATDRHRPHVTPLVDGNTLLAIESLFGKGAIDPWAVKLASTFTDLFIYADHFRFTFRSPDGAFSDASWAHAPSLTRHLQQRDSSAVVPQMVPIEPEKLHDDHVEDAFHRFAIWARNNRRSLRQWLNTHDTASIRAMLQAQVGREYYYFTPERVTQERELKLLALELGWQQCEILYAFDNVICAPLYGRLTGNDQQYLNHPTRNASLLPTFEAEVGTLPTICVSFKESMTNLVRDLSFDEYCVMLHEIRGAVRSRGLHELGPGDVDKEVLRDISKFVREPLRLRGIKRLARLAGGVIGGLGVIPALGAAAAVAGAVVSVSSAIWTGRLPRFASRIKWLRGGLEGDLEKQAERRG